MKKFKLFLAACAAMVGLSANAQLTDGTVYWIQDTGTGQFISQGADWGTQATVKNVSGLGFEVAYVSDGVYKLKNVMWNKMNNAERGLGSGRYVDSGTGNGSSTIAEVTLTASGDGYKLSIDGNYLTNNGSAKDYSGTKVLGSTTDASLATVWKFLTKAEYDAALSTIKNNRAAELATIVGLDGITSFSALETELAGTDYVSVDQTSKITNAALNAGNIDGWTGTAPNQRTLAFGSENGTCAESWNGVAWARQTISNLPNGLYKVTFVGTFRPGTSANAQTLTSEQTSSPAYVYANNDCEEFIHWIDVSTKANNRSGVVNNASNYTSTFYTYVSNGTIELGVVQDAYYGTQTWCPFGHFTLTHIYSIAMYKKAYDEAMTAATDAQTSLTGFSVYASQKSTLDAAITENTLSGDDLSDVDKLTEAANNLNAAAEAVVKEKAACDQYASIASAIEGNTNVNLTSYVNNASFETGDLSSWTSTDGGGVANNNNWSAGKDGTYFVERWTWAGASQTTLFDGTLTHDGIVLPAGVYQISAKGQVQQQYNGTIGGGYYLYGNSEKVEIHGTDTYTTYVKLDTNKSELVIKFALESCTGNWISCDNVQLTYVGEDFPAYTLVEGKMSNAAAQAQTAAETTFMGDKTVANYNALLTAITAAQASKDAYAVAASAVADAKALQTNYTFVTSAAATTFAEAIAAIETPYNKGSLADADANNAGRTLGVVMVDWHAEATNTAASNYMISAWPSTYTINDWSWEGNDDGSNFKVPFFQDWVADGESLAAKTMTGTLTGLENGLYSVTAWVRVRAKNETAVADATGITMDVNAGTAVDVTEGTQVGETQFQLKEYTAEGLVKDGSLALNFNVLEGNNISWLSYKNITYTKVRDLTPEEMAVAPTAIALYNDETEVTEVALDATTTSVTLTPQFTPADATPTVTWASSDETVAIVDNGVVTAVASGTATITVTSTIASEVSAATTINVTFPETEVASEDVVIDGPAKSTVAYGDNLIKNGTFQYPNPFQGWKSGANGNCDANNFNIVTDGENKYIQAKDSKGAGDSHSISTGWPIEAGKTYVFGYKVKANTAGNSQYHVVSMTNEIGTETAKVSDDATPVTTSWTDVKYKFTNNDGYAFVQFRARWLANSTSFDDFYLVEVISESTVGNVQYAIDAIPTSNIGTGAFQYSQDAIDAANALVQGTATVADVEAAYNALQVLNAPASDAAFNIVMGELTWTNNNNATMLSTKGKAVTYYAGGRSDGGGYTSQFDKVPNTNLAQAFYFTPAEGLNKYKVYQIDADGMQRYLCTGVVYGGNANQVRTTTEVNSAEVYTITATATEGVYNFTNASGINLGAQDAGLYGTARNNNLLIVPTTKPSITINTTAAGWGTTILPFAVAEIPEGVKVYTCAEADGATLTLVEVGALEANKPYIIEGAWNETLTGDAQGTALSYKEGLLTGTYARIPAPNGAYILQKHDDKVGFFQVNTETAQPNVPANRAYLTAPTTSGVKAFYLGENDLPTAIQSVFDGLVDGDAYDLAGRKVQKLQKGGVYIINGKKVVVK